MFPHFHSPSIIWVPCVADHSTGTYVPVYNLTTIPQEKSKRLTSLSRGGIKTKPWLHEEDAVLKELVEEFGVKKWSKIATVLNERFCNNRKGKNCRERWNNHLNSTINKGEWTYEEDLKLLTMYKDFGRKWSTISKGISGRTENAVKNRWNTLIKSYQQNGGNANTTMAIEYLIFHIASVIRGTET